MKICNIYKIVYALCVKTRTLIKNIFKMPTINNHIVFPLLLTAVQPPSV